MYNKKNKNIVDIVLGNLPLFLIPVVLLLLFVGCLGFPKYNVWRAELAGRAEYVQAEANRRIRVLEAEAEKDSAAALAEAEIIRAQGLAESNLIIGDSLRDNPEYLRYLWIQGLHDSRGERIYIPTEASLPIFEARPQE